MADPIKPAAPAATVQTAPVTMPAFTKEQEAYIQQLVIQTALSVQQSLAAANTGPKRTNHNTKEQCIVCRQVKAACKGEHTKMVVYPTKYPEYGTYFTGVKINDVVYYSFNENYKIEVPTACVSTIINVINAFEQNEKTVKMGRNKTHNSGSIGKHGKGFTKAEAAWR